MLLLKTIAATTIITIVTITGMVMCSVGLLNYMEIPITSENVAIIAVTTFFVTFGQVGFVLYFIEIFKTWLVYFKRKD